MTLHPTITALFDTQERRLIEMRTTAQMIQMDCADLCEIINRFEAVLDAIAPRDPECTVEQTGYRPVRT